MMNFWLVIKIWVTKAIRLLFIKNNSNNDYYSVSKQSYLKRYWENNNGSDIFRPNGFNKLPVEIYNAFCEQISGNGKLLDLGCGNGLLMKYIIWHSKYTLVPYGVDFCEPSVNQAKNLKWVGQMSHVSGLKLERKDYHHVSIGIYIKR